MSQVARAVGGVLGGGARRVGGNGGVALAPVRGIGHDASVLYLASCRRVAGALESCAETSAAVPSSKVDASLASRRDGRSRRAHRGVSRVGGDGLQLVVEHVRADSRPSLAKPHWRTESECPRKCGSARSRRPPRRGS